MPHPNHRITPKPTELAVIGLLVCGIPFAAIASDQSERITSGETIRFNADIRPLLSDRCFQCHGPDEKKREADLRFDLESDAKKDLGGYHAIVGGDLDASELIDRITASDPDERMPPADSGKSLSQAEIDLIKRWIAQGADFEKHWSFRTPERPSLPKVADTQWPRNEIDFFVLHQLEQNEIQPAPAADRNTLIRRLSLDLTGLPPTPQETADFVNDNSDRAYERVVDRLLASDHFGERMGRHWLDLARYADSNGYANDGLRSIWPFRDWVIKAFNNDMPFHQFTIEQLAGDLLPNPGEDQLVATGFHRNTPHQTEGGSDPEQYRVERTKNRTDTTGAVWLGLTVGCAQCHTHKFDPITHAEYYQLYAFFNNADEPNYTLTPTPETTNAIAALKQTIGDLEAEIRKLNKETDAKVLAKTEKEKKRATNELKQVERSLAKTMVMRERSQPRKSFVQLRGDFLDPGPTVTPQTFSVLHPMAADRASPTRLDLARWLTSRSNPLTPRVQANRMWQHLFGSGLVETENDFGYQGDLPSHPELLDFLAIELMDGGWQMKRLYKLIAMSATYRQSSNYRADVADRDPKNRWLARQNRFRVEGEIVRDVALATSGLLSRKVGGRSVFPPIPANVIGTSSANHRWPTSKGPDRYRRGVYTAVYRANVYPMLLAFDGPDRDNACTKRTLSNTPLQALTIANDEVFVEMAREFGKRIHAHQNPADDQTQRNRSRVNFAYKVALSREPTTLERSRILEFQRGRRTYYESNPSEAESIAKQPSPELASWIAVARTVINLDEFITRE